MSLILMLNPSRCPQCGKRNTIRWDQHRCCECNAKAFKPSDDFVALRRDFVNSYWVFFDPRSSGCFRGWVNSTHLDSPKPNAPEIKFTAPSRGYGQRPATGSADTPVSEMGAEMLKPAVG